MEYHPHYDAQMYRHSITQSSKSETADKQLFYYDPSARQYWDPKKDEHLSPKEVIELMHKSLTKITVRFDSNFPG